MDILVEAHSGIRWLVLLAMLAAIVLAARNLRAETWTGGAIKPFVWSSILFDIQVALGLILYVGNSGWDQRGFIAYFHPVIMIAALGVWHAFIARARKNDAPSSYRILLIGAVLALALVVAGIPWAGS
jgi:hypothetical protein